MQFPVPQFIDIEDKIIGPFTLKQFGFIGGGGILIVALFRLLGTGFVFWILAVPIALVTLFVSFGSFNGKPIYSIFPVFIKFFTSAKTYLFKHDYQDNNIKIEPLDLSIIKKAEDSSEEPLDTPQNRLKKISMLLDQRQQEEMEALNLPKKIQK